MLRHEVEKKFFKIKINKKHVQHKKLSQKRIEEITQTEKCDDQVSEREGKQESECNTNAVVCASFSFDKSNCEKFSAFQL